MSHFGIDFGPFLQALTTLGGICGIFGLFAFVQSNWMQPFRAELDANPAARHDAAKRLTDRRWWGPYRRALDRGLRRLDRWMGKPEEWARGFNLCLLLGLAYPLMTLVVSWSVGVSATIGNSELLPRLEALSISEHAAVLIGATATFLAIIFINRMAVCLALVVLGTLAATMVAAIAIISVAISIFGIVASFRSTSYLAVFLFIVGSIWIDSEILSDDFFAVLVLFSFIVPWLNAFFDAVSWQVSRRLGQNLLRQLDSDDRNWRRRLWDNPLTHMVVDILAAVALLLGLAWALPAVIRLYNRFVESLGSSAPLMLDGYLCEAARDPLGAGIWATVMLISTLVPTLIHLGFVFASPFIAMFKPHPVWDARAAHLEGQGPPPAVDLRGTSAGHRSSYDPASSNPGLGEPGKPWLPPLHPETTKAVAWELRVAQPVLQLMMITAAALLLLNLVLVWDHAWTPVPAWLLWAAHGFDEFPVQQCLGVWL